MSVSSRSSNFLARTRSVQRDRPSGGSEQARRMRYASSRPSSFVSYSRSGFLRSLASIRSRLWNFFRVRQAVERLQSSASAIAESLSPSSAFSRMRARVIFWALCLPYETIASSFSRSISVRSIGYSVSPIAIFSNLVARLVF